MILPAPENPTPISKFPLTWTLVALNIFLFVLIFSGAREDYSKQKLFQQDYLEITGRLYHQYLQVNEKVLLKKPLWIQSLKFESKDQMEVLGAYALRDKDFLDHAEVGQYRGDQIQIDEWRYGFKQFREYYYEQTIFRFGLHSFTEKPLAWITYQFSHSGWMHLLSNLVFLIVIGLAVEGAAGSLWVVVVYLLGGFAGGFLFLTLNSHGSVPMVGASASVSALLAFYSIVETRKRVRYLFFISPIPGQHGSIYLPTLLIFPLFLLVDFASLLATPEGFGSGVAYSAHIGGTICGLILGAIFHFMPRASIHPNQNLTLK